MANGRVITGFSKPYVALYQASAGTITYSNGRILARGVEVSVEPDSSDDNKFFADNVQAESADGIFTGGTVNLTVDGLYTDSEKLIMGIPAADADGNINYGDNQKTPYIGVGFITRYMSDGITTYMPYVIVKTKFALIPLSASTQEQEIDWQTTDLSASIMRGDDANHTWKKHPETAFDSEDLAEEWIKNELNISNAGVYSVEQNLVHTTSDFSGTAVTGGTALTIELTAASTYTLDTVVVIMGGVDITATAYDAGTISIASVTGDVVITAVSAA